MTRGEMLLLQTAEEASEVAQALSKRLRFGSNDVYPMQDGTAGNRVICELIDLLTMIDMCQAEGLIPVFDPAIVPRLMELKRQKVEKYLLYSKDKGTLV